jgi:integrase
MTAMTGHSSLGAAPGDAFYQGARPRPAVPDPSAGLLRRFPPRPVAASWAATAQPRQQVIERLRAAPFAGGGSAHLQWDRGRGLGHILGWLEQHAGATWQDRWIASGADEHGNSAWRELPRTWLAAAGQGPGDPANTSLMLGRAMLMLVCGDVIRPSPAWLLTPITARNLVAGLARTRDPAGFAALDAACQDEAVNTLTTQLACRRIAIILAAKGGLISDITIGDCLELLRIADDLHGSAGATSPYFYQLLRTIGVLAGGAPGVRGLRTQGRLGCEQLIDRYEIACRPVRDLLVDYLRERQPTVDYATLHKLSYTLGRLFWRDLERYEPGIGSLRLNAETAAAWKQRITTKSIRPENGDGKISPVTVTRINAIEHMITVRSFYLDITQWAVDDPARWGPWVAPCPVRDGDVAQLKKTRSHRKSRMDQRTRERMPVLPALLAAVDDGHAAALQRLQAALSTAPGGQFTAAGQTLTRSRTTHASAGKTWAEDPGTGKRRDLTLEEHQAFWTWAAVHILRDTGIRIEELTELSHHSLIQYRLPTSGELIPLLHIAPSKTDIERLLVIGPELADVLATIVRRIRNEHGAVPLAVAYDYHERIWNPPIPLLFQRRFGGETRPIGGPAIRELLNDALSGTGMTDASSRPLRFTPHDFRRIFITDAIMHGMPPHIAQLVAGHHDINTTMGYKAVYPRESIDGHRAFITRRRELRPSGEYRTPTDEEWQEFLGHFERRKVALGDCGRAYQTPCIHENACIRCALLRPDPAQRPRLAGIRDNLHARIAEARQQGWLGEVEGLKVSLAAAVTKLAQLDALAARRDTAVNLGMPGFSQAASRTITTPASLPASKETP